MSTQPISVQGSSAPAGELAIAERIQQIEAMLSQAEGSASATGATSGSSTDFASALQNATASAASTTTTSGGTQYEALIQQAAERNGVDPAVLHGLIQQESNFDPSAQSSAGATGLTQLMPGTATSVGVSNPLDAAESIEGGARYLGRLMNEFSGNTTDALAAYNAGPAAVKQYGGVPPYAETESYVSKVLGYAEAYRQQTQPTTAAGVLL
jgi:soluble lytic murein transglycosylase-like protein